MARFYIEGVDAASSDLAVGNRIDTEFIVGTDEHRAARMLYRYTALHPILHDRHGRQNAVDILLRSRSGPVAVLEVSSTTDETLQRDMHNSLLLEKQIAAEYAGDAAWVLHFHSSWTVPPQRQRRRLAVDIAAELLHRGSSGADGYLQAAPEIYAWRSSIDTPGVVARGWDSRVGDIQGGSVSGMFEEFLNSPSMRRKREKLVADAVTLHAPRRVLYLMTTPTGANAHLGSAHILDLADGSFTLPPDVEELWLDGRGSTIRRYILSSGWTEFNP